MTSHTNLMTFIDANEFPEDVQPHGTFAAAWCGSFLALAPNGARVQTSASFPGMVNCTATFTAESITITIELKS